MTEWYLSTPTLSGLSKLINMYAFFNFGYLAGLADDLAYLVLSDEELEALQELLKQTRNQILD